jgi:hypothetical protein
LRRADTGIENIRVKGWLGCHGQYFAIARIQQHRRCAFLDLIANGLLQSGIHGNLHILAGDAFTPVQFADNAAKRIHFNLHRTCAPAQNAVMKAFQPGAAHAHAGQMDQAFLTGVLFGGRADIA